MLQNKFLFNQSSVSLEIIGLPDYSNNEHKDEISIISKWKLQIIDRPLIEGNIDHLRSLMKAFNIYSSSLLNDEATLYESDLIDIKPENCYTHVLLLKSSKSGVKPLNITIGNSILADIVNCFDQLASSNRVKIIYTKGFKSPKNKKYFHFLDTKNISNYILPPLVSLCSIFVISTALIYFYDGNENNNRSILNTKTYLLALNP